jgi:2'-5' RNA ligase
MIRLFAAVPIPDEIAGALASRQGGIKGARWRPRDALHLTLRFYGELREDIARDLDAELLGVRIPAFEISLAGAGVFSEDGEPRVVWAGVEENAALNRLARACETAARRAGLKAETRPYRPHVTLAYLRQVDAVEVAHWVQANNLLKSPPIRVDRFGLYSSRPSSKEWGGEGPHYELEAEYPL